MNANLCFADSSFFNFFSFKLLSGDKNRVLQARNNAVISRTFANKLFGTDDPIGQSIRISDSTSVMVTGVMEDIKIRQSLIPTCCCGSKASPNLTARWAWTAIIMPVLRPLF